jgi:tetratricopeptide (TPR) repeat protein
MAEGGLHYRSGEYQKAYESYSRILDAARSVNDIAALAGVHKNLGSCLIEVGDLTAANIHFSEAVRHFTDAGCSMEAARTDMGIGTLFVRRGDADLAMPHLTKARDTFLRSSMPEEAGICGTLMMEAMLIRGNAARAQTIARELARQLDGSRVSQQARDAIAYAESAIAAHDGAIAAVRHVQDFFESLRFDPARAFVAPA